MHTIQTNDLAAPSFGQPRLSIYSGKAMCGSINVVAPAAFLA
jgi:hypothetical protein